MLTYEEAIKTWSYDPETGQLTWLMSGTGRKTDGCAGTISKEGYRVVIFNRRKHYAHRLAFLLFYGDCPEEIDHVDHNRSNNRINNLRSVSHSQNLRNASRSIANKSGVTGVFYGSNIRKWIANIRVNSKKIYIGCFSEKADAIDARKAAEVEYGYHPNHGTERK